MYLLLEKFTSQIPIKQWLFKNSTVYCRVRQYTFFSIVTYHISIANVRPNYCNNNLLNLDVKQLNKIMIKLSYFYTLKALWDGQSKIKMYYGMSRFKKQLSGKKSINEVAFKTARTNFWKPVKILAHRLVY